MPVQMRSSCLPRASPAAWHRWWPAATGTPPIVRETGGLRDSIHDSTMGQGNGFTFAGYSAHELYEACCHAQDAYYDKENWSNLVHYVMSCDFSWDVSAKSYEGLYNETANLW